MTPCGCNRRPLGEWQRQAGMLRHSCCKSPSDHQRPVKFALGEASQPGDAGGFVISPNPVFRECPIPMNHGLLRIRSISGGINSRQSVCYPACAIHGQPLIMLGASMLCRAPERNGRPVRLEKPCQTIGRYTGPTTGTFASRSEVWGFSPESRR